MVRTKKRVVTYTFENPNEGGEVERVLKQILAEKLAAMRLDAAGPAEGGGEPCG